MRKTKIWSLLATVAVFLCCNPAIAGSPDALPAANEGVCNELLDATPGLYGLCLAFCEAQDCQPDYSLENPFEPLHVRLAESSGALRPAQRRWRPRHALHTADGLPMLERGRAGGIALPGRNQRSLSVP